MSTSHKVNCDGSFVREIKFSGNGGLISCHYCWRHVTLTLKNPPEFIDGKALIGEIAEINFNESIFPSGGEQWENLDDKLDRKLQKMFDSISEMGEPESSDGRDKCLSKAFINKLLKLGFEIESDNYFIDNNRNKK